VKVILKQDIASLGQKGDIKEVSAGYARNYLIPKGLAEKATQGRLRDHKMKDVVKAKKTTREIENAQEKAELLSKKVITIKTKAGESGRLFGSVTAGDIAEAVAAEGIKVNRRKIELKEPLKSLGNFQVKIRLHQEIAVWVEVVVERA
jgi:large subunit ribosomal protein L9